MINSPKTAIIILSFSILQISSCKKYLDAKPNAALTTPKDVTVLQALLDNNRNLNWLGSEAGEAAADNFYITDVIYNSLSFNCQRRQYLWQPQIYSDYLSNNTDWAREYNVVYQSNVVLDNIGLIQRDTTNGTSWDNCKGSALVFRAKAFFEIAQIWAKAYDSLSANADLGIVLRLSSDFNIPSERATIKDTYDRIIRDLEDAVPLLPNNPTNPLRPSKGSAYGLLARTFLTIGDYGRSKLMSDSCIQISGTLWDYNTLDLTSSHPFTRFANPEDLMHSFCTGSTYLDEDMASIDTLLYRSYDTNDLRKYLFFYFRQDSSIAFKGSYEPRNSRYNGIATDEIYLTRAEANARLGNVSTALKDLNKLLMNRWKTGSYIPFTGTSQDQTLNLILTERRKELVMRMLRFTDIKRLNKIGGNITQKRVINSQVYTIMANDPRYALPIPDDVIKTTGIQQN